VAEEKGEHDVASDKRPSQCRIKKTSSGVGKKYVR
jgi:hypothetical protein